jgi:Fe-S-cluster-containing dehydrogenase component
MMKCDMCYDRSSEGKKPMCASVCPSQALFFGTREEVARLRPRSRPVNQFQFGNQLVKTKVSMMVPAGRGADYVDVTAALEDRPRPRTVPLDILGSLQGVGVQSTPEVPS